MVASAQGIDVSSWQSSMPLGGLEFVFCRASIGDGSLTTPPGQTAGAVTRGVDAKFAAFWKQAADAGIVRGAYHFFEPSLPAAAQAKLFVATLKAQGLKPGDVLVCDSETSDPFVDGQTLAFCSAVTSDVPASNPVLVYTNHNVGQYLVKTAARYPAVWFAWPSSTAPPASFIVPFQRWVFWQYAIKDGVDADAFNGTAADLRAWIATYTKETSMALDANDVKTILTTDGILPNPLGSPGNPDWAWKTHITWAAGQLSAITAAVAALADKVGAPVDPAQIAQAVLAGLTPAGIAAAVVAALPPELAGEVVDEIKARL